MPSLPVPHARVPYACVPRLPSTPGRRVALGLLSGLCLLPVACDTVPRHALRDSQMTAYRQYRQGQVIAAERDRANLTAQQAAAQAQMLAGQNQTLTHQVGKLNSDLTAASADLSIARKRLDNLAAERGELQNRYVSLLKSVKDAPNPLDAEARRRFEELSRKYPNFEFDPATGVSKFHSDILFSSGSDALNPTAIPLLQEFASILNGGTAQGLGVLIVGHTDDQDISKPGTAAKHPTNWHLSTNRANAVALSLARVGLREDRMGVSGYGKYQPAAANTGEAGRQKNRRVEIFVLAPDALVAGWERPTISIGKTGPTATMTNR